MELDDERMADADAIELPARGNDIYDHKRVELLIGAISERAIELDCNLLEVEAATRSLNAVVKAELKVNIDEARERAGLPPVTKKNRSWRRKAARAARKAQKRAEEGNA